MQDNPSNVELIASTAVLMLLLRQIIEQTDRGDRVHVDASMDAIHEYLAVCGGSMLVLAEQLGLGAEVDATIMRRRQRLASLQASGGLSGRA